MKIPISVMTGFTLLMVMFCLMTGLNQMALETRKAWHYYTESVAAVVDSGGDEDVCRKAKEDGKKQGYDIEISQHKSFDQVTLSYTLELPVIALKTRQRISGYAYKGEECE